MINITLTSMSQHPTRTIEGEAALTIWKILTSDDSDTKARYAMLKTDFDKTHIRVLNPPGYAVKVGDRWVRYTRANLKDVYSGLYIDRLEKKRFIDEWLKDTIPTYAGIGYYVNASDCPPNVFNTNDKICGGT
jgi:hypothetical protein